MLSSSKHLAAAIFTTFAVVGAALLSGCGNPGHSPLASDGSPGVSGESKAAAFLTKPKKTVESSATGLPSTSSTLHYRTDETTVSNNSGGNLNVSFSNYGGKNDIRVKKATLSIEAGSIVDAASLHQITMAVYSGATLNDIHCVFGPSGMSFAPYATMTITLGGPVSPADVAQVTHVFGDGAYVEKIKTETDKKGQVFLVVKLKVPGFSRYSVGPGDEADAVDDEGWW